MALATSVFGDSISQMDSVLAAQQIAITVTIKVIVCSVLMVITVAQLAAVSPVLHLARHVYQMHLPVLAARSLTILSAASDVYNVRQIACSAMVHSIVNNAALAIN
jgi:hypothetical protein